MKKSDLYLILSLFMGIGVFALLLLESYLFVILVIFSVMLADASKEEYDKEEGKHDN